MARRKAGPVMRAMAAACSATAAGEMSGPAIAGDHADGVVARLAAGVERREAGCSPVLGPRAVQAEGGAGREQREAAHAVRVVEGGVLGDHAAHREADHVRPVVAQRVEQAGDRVGQGREGQRAVERCGRAVAGEVPGHDAVPGAQPFQLRSPGRAATAEAVEEDHRLPSPASRHAMGPWSTSIAVTATTPNARAWRPRLSTPLT